jgi:hypothetical protein
MNSRPTALERAFELAATGEHQNASDVRLELRREGYSCDVIEGRSLLKQLTKICLEAKAAEERDPS